MDYKGKKMEWKNVRDYHQFVFFAIDKDEYEEIMNDDSIPEKCNKYLRKQEMSINGDNITKDIVQLWLTEKKLIWLLENVQLLLKG